MCLIFTETKSLKMEIKIVHVAKILYLSQRRKILFNIFNTLKLFLKLKIYIFF